MMNMKKLAALFLSLALTVSALAGCGSTSTSETTSTAEAQKTEADTDDTQETEAEDNTEDTYKAISYGMSYDASTLDTGMTTDDASLTPVLLLTEGLLRTQGEEIIPGLAESWESSEDSLVWTFHLRQSTFSDGTPVTAETLAYTLKRLITPENALDNMSTLADLVGAEEFMSGEGTIEDVGIEVVDEYTLKLTYKYPQFEKNFAYHTYAPVCQEVVESAGEAYGSETEYFLGNGPFMLQEWSHDEKIVMVKNPNYWNADAIKLDEITQIAGATGDTAIDMMNTDTLDAAGFGTKMYLDSALEIPGMTSTVMYNGSQSIHANCKGKTEETKVWLSNANFRKALSYAMDRTAMVAAVYSTDMPAERVVPDTEMGVNESFNKEYDYEGFNVTAEPEKAQEYLAKAMEEIGVSDVSEIPTFTMLAFDSENNVKCLNAIADMWSKNLGIKCEMDMEPIMEMLNKAIGRDYDFWKGGNGLTFDYVGFFGNYDLAAGLGAGVSYDDDEAYHELYIKAVSAPTWKDRKDAEAELASYWTENMMDLMITWQASYVAYSEKISDVYDGYMFADFTFADIAE